MEKKEPPMHPTTREAAHKAIQAVLAVEPDLSANGFGPYGGAMKLIEADAEFQKDRAHMLDDDSCKQFERACAWLSRRTPIKSFNKSRTSYGLKHTVESWHRDNGVKGDVYVSNGVFIAAALHMGFRYHRVHQWRSPNCFFNISEKSIKESA